WDAHRHGLDRPPRARRPRAPPRPRADRGGAPAAPGPRPPRRGESARPDLARLDGRRAAARSAHLLALVPRALRDRAPRSLREAPPGLAALQAAGPGHRRALDLAARPGGGRPLAAAAPGRRPQAALGAGAAARARRPRPGPAGGRVGF